MPRLRWYYLPILLMRTQSQGLSTPYPSRSSSESVAPSIQALGRVPHLPRSNDADAPRGCELQEGCLTLKPQCLAILPGRAGASVLTEGINRWTNEWFVVWGLHRGGEGRESYAWKIIDPGLRMSRNFLNKTKTHVFLTWFLVLSDCLLPKG